MAEKQGAVTFKGQPMTLVGDGLAEGQPLPDCELIANDLSPKKLSDYRGKTLVLATVPSLDTGVCDTMTRHFNEKAAALGNNVAVVTVSVDLPFAQKRWCGHANVDNVETLSDYKENTFGNTTGLRIKELGLLARSVSVINAEGQIVYHQLVPEIAEEPDYDAALNAVKQAG